MHSGIKFKQEHALFTVEGINSEWSEVLPLATQLAFSKGEEISAVDSNSFYFLIDGTIKLSCLAPTGSERVVMLIRSGSLFGEINQLHFSQLHTNIFYAVEASTVAKFSRALLEDVDFYRTYPHLAKNIVHSLGIKAGAFFSQLFDSGVVSAESQVCRALYQLWQQDGQRQVACPNITQSEFATMLGIHRSSLCRILHSLREDEVIGKFVKKEMVVLRPDVLARKAGVLE